MATFPVQVWGALFSQPQASPSPDHPVTPSSPSAHADKSTAQSGCQGDQQQQQHPHQQQQRQQQQQQ